MYILKDENNIEFKNKDRIVVFMKLNDAVFFKGCLKSKAEIENINFLPLSYVICELKGLISNE